MRLRRRVLGCALIVFAVSIQAIAESESTTIPAGSETIRPAAIDHARNHHQIVSLTSYGPIPRTARFKEDDAIAWLSYLSTPAVISFDSDVGKQLTCASPSLFKMEEGQLSASLDELGFASLCHLAPGEYEYTVSLTFSGEAVEKYTGTLIVAGLGGSQ